MRLLPAIAAGLLVAAASLASGAAIKPAPGAETTVDGGAKQPAAAPPQIAGAVYHGSRKVPRVALTFDACSVRGDDHVDQAVLDTLIQRNVPATLFLGGLWMEDDPDVVAKLKDNPLFELESHSYLHPHLTHLSNASLQSEVDRSQADFEKLVGHKATYLRAPYAELDSRVVTLLKKNGLTPIQYDLASGDPDKHFTKKVLVRWVVKHSQPGSIIVMHMNGRGWHTAESLPDIIDGLRQRGFELVKVSDLVAPPATAPPPAPAPPAKTP